MTDQNLPNIPTPPPRTSGIDMRGDLMADGFIRPREPEINEALAMADLGVSTVYPGVLMDLNRALTVLAAEVRWRVRLDEQVTR